MTFPNSEVKEGTWDSFNAASLAAENDNQN